MRLSNKTPDSLVQSKSGNGANSTLASALGSPDFHLPFFHYLAIPKSTTQAGYLSNVLVMPICRINRIWIETPRGCSGLAGLQVWHGVTQIFPLPYGVWFKSDNSVISFAFSHDMNAEPYELELRGYNNDDTYQHTLWIAFEVSGQQSDLPPQLAGLVSYLRST